MLNITITIILLLFMGFYWIFYGLGVRNEKVHAELMRVLNIVDSIAKEEIDEGKGFPEWRYSWFKPHLYDEMLFKFWKPVDSFFKDHPCLKK